MVCPFHGWRWNIDGSCSHVFGRNGFRPEVVGQADVALPECQVELWGGHVWINMDRSAGPLRDALFPVNDVLDGMGVENMRVKWWKETILNCNWKIAQEAFFEGYHVMQTHPQLFLADRDENDELLPYASEYTTFVNGHGRFQSGDTKMSYGGRSFLKHMRLLCDGQDAMTLERDMHIFEGLMNKIDPDSTDFAAKAIDALYEYADGAGIPMPEYDAVKMRLWGGDVFLFPNYLMLPMYGNCLSYRIRPYHDDPDWCRFEVWSLTTYPEGQEPGRAVLDGRFDKDDADGWGLIPRQDFGNLERMQRGIKSPSFSETRLSHLWEQTISNMHEELDRRLAADDGRPHASGHH